MGLDHRPALRSGRRHRGVYRRAVIVVIYFEHHKITTKGNWHVGTVWPFRGCEVEMHEEGFSCTCKKRPTTKCNHIKSVELGLLGVGQQYWK